MANPFSKVRDLIHSLEGDFEKFYDKQNAAAGTRVRKGMQELKNMAQQLRLEVQNQKNTAKTDGAASGGAASGGGAKKASGGAAAGGAKKAAGGASASGGAKKAAGAAASKKK